MRARTVALVALALLFLLACAGFALPFDFLIPLTLGWGFYLYEVVPEVRVGWSGVATAVVCLALFSAGLHAFLRWFHGQVHPNAQRPWRARWTLSVVGGVMLMFVAGIAATGVTHQVGWLINSPGPWAEGSMRFAVYRTQSNNNLKQIGLGVNSYHENSKTIPPGGFYDSDGRALHSWQTMILPYAEQDSLYGQIDLTVPWSDPRNEGPFRTQVLVYLQPGPRDLPNAANDGYALSHYAGNSRVLGGNEARPLSAIKDGTSTTILAGEVAAGFKPWGMPGNWRDPARGINGRADGFGSAYEDGGTNMLFADGSVRWIKKSISPRVLKALSTPAGGEMISADEY